MIVCGVITVITVSSPCDCH